MVYNWQLWDNFVAAAEELDLNLRSTDGGCVYMEVPEDIRQRFYVMCWTPLNKLNYVMKQREEGSVLNDWQYRLKQLRANHSDFHLEFGAKQYKDGSMFWFPNLSYGSNPSKQEIVDAVKIMLDRDNFEKYRVMAILREPAE